MEAAEARVRCNWGEELGSYHQVATLDVDLRTAFAAVTIRSVNCGGKKNLQEDCRTDHGLHGLFSGKMIVLVIRAVESSSFLVTVTMTVDV